MAAVCEVCGKHPNFGKTYARLGKGAMNRRIKAKTSRRFNPNIQRIRAMVNGSPTRLHVCTGCIKSGKVTKPPMKTRAAG